MATFRYFAVQGGQTVALRNDSIQHDGRGSKARNFSGLAPDGVRVVCERMIERKSSPSMHKCGPRCVAATRFLCECSCGGKNHATGDGAARAEVK